MTLHDLYARFGELVCLSDSIQAEMRNVRQAIEQEVRKPPVPQPAPEPAPEPASTEPIPEVETPQS